ncbi:MAG TPA: efflux RND transporter periplasmic adaptor subunit [Candidatus Eisenbacteria bacterium]|nr:efflux RND transporter periplasmic adaptor subunit [Candidatus Eisenbacteria bacterium]
MTPGLARHSMRLVLLALVAAFAAVGCGKEPAANGAPRGAKGGGKGGGRASAFPVEVVPVEERKVEYEVHAVGSVEAFEIVRVTARVPGAVEAIRFKEGDRVEENQVLVSIEPMRYQLALEEAKSNLQKSEAALGEAEAGLARRVGVNEKTPGLIPGEEVGTWRTRLATAQADVAASKAAVAIAERNARDARAFAPVAGTIQTRDVQTGMYVQPGTLLTTLVRREPLLLRFQVPEDDASRLSPGFVARFTVRNIPGERRARITLVGASADPATRMTAVTAEVVRPDGALRPGAFAEVTVPIGGAKSAPVVPETAVRPSERGFVAYIVKGGVAHERLVTLGLRTADGRIEVKQGLAAGDSLVVRGAEALSEGAAVRLPKGGGA